MPATNTDTTAFIHVTVDSETFLVEIFNIEEILPMLALTQPRFSTANNQNPRYRGILNLRGEVIPAFDCISTPRAYSPDHFLLVYRKQPELFAFIVDNVKNVISIADHQIHKRKIAENQYHCFVTHEDSVLSVFDPISLVYSEELN